MGKKSKRKGAKAKESHKARMKAREARREEEQLTYDEQVYEQETEEEEEPLEYGGKNRPYLKGDFVRFYEKPDSFTRGTLIDVKGEKHVFLSYDKEKQAVVRRDRLHPDLLCTYLRFKKGDKVICRDPDDGLGKVCLVHYVWPRMVLHVPKYQCLTIKREHNIWIHEDDDFCMFAWPTDPRFKVGDNVIFNAAMALADDPAMRYLKDGWKKGTIVKLHATEEDWYRGTYACSFRANRKEHLCYIFLDNDEYISRPDTAPRARLMEAIKADLTYDHISYLIEEFDIDVSSFRKEVLAQAIEHASYNTLWWLEKNLGEDLYTSKDKDGKFVVDRIAYSPNILRFLKKAVEIESGKTSGIDIMELFSSRHRTKSKGWPPLLKTLMRRNVHAFDFAISPEGFGHLFFHRMFDEDEDENLLLSYVDELKETDPSTPYDVRYIRYLVERFLAFKELDNFSDGIQFGDSAENVEQAFPKEEELSRVMTRRYLRFLWDFKGVPRISYRSLHREELYRGYANIVSLIKIGEFRVCKLFMEEDDNLASESFLNQARGRYIHVYCDHDQYVEPDLVEEHKGKSRDYWEELSLMDLLIHGKKDRSDGFVIETFDDALASKSYNWNLRRFLLKGGDILDWCDEMKNLEKDLDEDESKYGKCLQFKRRILQDDEDLGYRLEFIEYLVKEKRFAPPNPFSCIRFRQCGVIRWLFEKDLVSIEGELDQVFMKYLRNSGLLGFSNLRDFDKGFILGFAAVHYDDFQTLHWLIGSFGVHKIGASLGVNLVHVGAYFGRIEIMALLRKFKAFWASSTQQPVKEGPLNGMFASHIAVTRGHICIANMLLKHCPTKDINRQSIFDYASKSDHSFVKRWGEMEIGTPPAERDTKKLIELLRSPNVDYDVAKEHVVNSEFMYWRHMDMGGSNTKGNCEKSFETYLAEIYEASGIDFSIWLCLQTYFISDSPFFASEYGPERCRTWIEAVECLSLFVDDEINTWVGQDFAKEIRCRDLIQSPHTVIKCAKGELKARLVSEVTRMDILLRLYKASSGLVLRLILHGKDKEELLDSIETLNDIRQKLEGLLLGFGLIQLLKYRSSVLSRERKIDMAFEHLHLPSELLDSSNFLDGQLFTLDSKRFHIQLVAQSDYEIAQFCLQNGSNLDSIMEFEMLYTASYLSRNDLLDLLLDDGGHLEHLNSQEDRFYTAALGAASRGHVDDCECYCKYIQEKVRADPIVVQDLEKLLEANVFSKDFEKRSLCLAFAGSILLSTRDSTRQNDKGCIESDTAKLLRFIAMGNFQRKHILLAALLVSMMFEYRPNIDRVYNGFVYLYKCLYRHRHAAQVEGDERLILKKVTSNMIEQYVRLNDKRHKSHPLEELLSTWTETLTSIGIKLNLSSDHSHFKAKWAFLTSLKNIQSKSFQRFDGLKHGYTLLQLQNEMRSGHLDFHSFDEEGMQVVHIAAAHDRKDVLKWLDQENEQILDSRDWQNRTALQVAKACKADEAYKWIRERQELRIIENANRKKEEQEQERKLHCGMSRFQARFRGHITRKSMRSMLLLYIEESHSFNRIWAGCMEQVEKGLLTFQSWESIRDTSLDFIKSDLGFDNAIDLVEMDHEAAKELTATMDKLDLAMESALDGEVTDDSMLTDRVEAAEGSSESQSIIDFAAQKGPTESSDTTYTTIMYTTHVAKWLKQGDPKYREIFIRRLKQLSKGERSRILAKRLKGSKMTIYETYLEQKSGFRILWTIEGDNLLVWYVAKHDYVSRLMQRIDESQSRSDRQLISAADLVGSNSGKSEESSEHKIMLDPLGNVPLKVFELSEKDFEEVTQKSWVPRLRLTKEERDVVETKGTVMLLGRSGTGKTVCICNRMDYDRRQSSAEDESFTQLFVARSRRLCGYVSEAVGSSANTFFQTFDELLLRLESELPTMDSVKKSFPRSYHMTFGRFKKEVYQVGDSEIDPLLVWASIRSFIKGSIEATQRPLGVVGKEMFQSFSMKRCKVSLEQRAVVYGIYERYEKYKVEFGMWDDCDRIMALLQRLEFAKSTQPDVFQKVRRSKIYIDEIQDYTQAECLLFFYLGGSGNLFFAGDPAQSVVEGVDFRFEDIRSVEYHIAKDRNELLLEKPKTVNVNFRSHAGVLDTAGAILNCMFNTFEHSAKKLKEDRGVFDGPRPGVFYTVSNDELVSLLKTLNGTCVLVHDSSVSRCRRMLGGYPLVYGIRAAKGLEFKSVIVLDFFRDLPDSVQRPWRDMLLGRADERFQRKYPEIEGQLKLLYTGVTRCIEQLFFAETAGSEGGKAFHLRWLTKTSTIRTKRVGNGSTTRRALATLAKTGEMQTMIMTKDEWLASGVENAELAENEDDPSTAESMLEKAIYCFQQANNQELAQKARTHRRSVIFQSQLPIMSKTSSLGNEERRRLEIEAANIVESLLIEGLTKEAKDLCDSILPFMPERAQEHLTRKLISKLNYN